MLWWGDLQSHMAKTTAGWFFFFFLYYFCLFSFLCFCFSFFLTFFGFVFLSFFPLFFFSFWTGNSSTWDLVKGWCDDLLYLSWSFFTPQGSWCVAKAGLIRWSPAGLWTSSWLRHTWGHVPPHSACRSSGRSWQNLSYHESNHVFLLPSPRSVLLVYSCFSAWVSSLFRCSSWDVVIIPSSLSCYHLIDSSDSIH